MKMSFYYRYKILCNIYIVRFISNFLLKSAICWSIFNITIENDPNFTILFSINENLKEFLYIWKVYIINSITPLSHINDIAFQWRWLRSLYILVSKRFSRCITRFHLSTTSLFIFSSQYKKDHAPFKLEDRKVTFINKELNMAFDFNCTSDR